MRKNQNFHDLSDFPFHYDFQTRWKDMDIFGHVNNAVFLTYVEDARITFFKRWNVYGKERSIILASAKIEYLRQINHPSKLIIGERISRIGRKSFDIEASVFIRDEKEPVVSSMVTCVCYDYAKNESLPVYSEIIADYQKS